jgi:hypothetical protein
MPVETLLATFVALFCAPFTNSTKPTTLASASFPEQKVTWVSIHCKVEQEEQERNSTDETGTEIPLSDEFQKELEEFIRPVNERLFELIDRPCNWCRNLK